MKAARNPSPLREFVFDAAMRVLRSPAAASPFTLLDVEAAAAVRRRRAMPRCWVQMHIGFLCEELRRETRRVSTAWQVGRQPGNWAWTSLEQAVAFMGALEAGQGQPAIVSVWAPAWMSSTHMLAMDVGPPPLSALDRCWRLRLRGLPAGAVAVKPEQPEMLLWRLKLGRQRPDTDLRSWCQKVL
jgi:hypothetical protein